VAELKRCQCSLAATLAVIRIVSRRFPAAFAIFLPLSLRLKLVLAETERADAAIVYSCFSLIFLGTQDSFRSARAFVLILVVCSSLNAFSIFIIDIFPSFRLLFSSRGFDLMRTINRASRLNGLTEKLLRILKLCSPVVLVALQVGVIEALGYCFR
jgi:hypothetical protein